MKSEPVPRAYVGPVRIVLALVATTVVVGAPVAAAALPRLQGAVTEDFTITLKRSGKRVTTLKAGRYTIVVRDPSSLHNFRLRGPGINRMITGVGFRGTKTVTLTLRKGRYIYHCDPHAFSMRGSFRVL